MFFMKFYRKDGLSKVQRKMEEKLLFYWSSWKECYTQRNDSVILKKMSYQGDKLYIGEVTRFLKWSEVSTDVIPEEYKSCSTDQQLSTDVEFVLSTEV